MDDVMKGNFKPNRTVDVKTETSDTLEDRFEREALKRLGGSVAFVAKRKIAWSLDDEDKK